VALIVWFCTCDTPGGLAYGLYRAGAAVPDTAKAAPVTFRACARYGGPLV